MSHTSRAALIKRIASMPGWGLPVNRRWCLQTRGNADIRYLLRKGLVKRLRVHTTAQSATTYLVLVEQPTPAATPRKMGALAARKERT